MWRKLYNSLPFFLSFTKDNGYCIYVTDYIKIWWVHYKLNDFLCLLQKCNDDLEMENEELLQLGLKMLLHPENLKKVNFTFKNKTMNISMVLSCGFPVYLDMQLTEGSSEMFYRKITQQLLKTVYDLKTSESELRFLLIKKDKEIEEYKTETDVRLAMYLKTGAFCDEEHMGKHTQYEKYFGTAEVSNCLLEKFIDDTEDQIVVKEEKQPMEEPKVKVEVASQQIIKSEPNSMAENEEQNSLCSATVKRETNNEANVISPKKKFKKLLKI